MPRLLALILLYIIFLPSLPSQGEELTRIAILQHFGSEETSNNIEIKSANPNSKLILRFGSSKQILNKLNLQVKSEQIPFWQINHQEKFGEREIILGQYSTYEDTEYHCELLKSKLPEEILEIVYARPWQIRLITYTPKQVQKMLSRQGIPHELTPINNSRHYLSWHDNERHARQMQINTTDNSPIQVGEYQYSGHILITPDSLGTYSVINILSIEEYLSGVVPYEIGSDAAAAALETQAILARTYLLANNKRYLREDYNLCASQHCQVYHGLSASNKKINQAIKDTTGQILKTPIGDVAEVYYYSGDGGHSASYSDAWVSLSTRLSGTSTCKGAPTLDLSNESDIEIFLNNNGRDWACHDNTEHNKYFRWKRKFTNQKLIESFNKANKIFHWLARDIKSINSLTVTERSKTGRIIQLQINYGNRQELTLERNFIRAAFNNLPSTFFTVQKSQNEYIFKGAGFGHGVGLSQYGARNLAQQGLSAKEILKIYFPAYNLGEY